MPMLWVGQYQQRHSKPPILPDSVAVSSEVPSRHQRRRRFGILDIGKFRKLAFGILVDSSEARYVRDIQCLRTCEKGGFRNS